MTRAQRSSLLHGLYVIVNEGALDPVPIARAVLSAGVRLVQYRAKSGVVDANLRALRELTRASGAMLILDDDWRAAREHECDGVHLGPDDDGYSRVGAVRAAMPDVLVGLSCANEGEARAAESEGADYVGVGSVYATATKRDAGDPIAIDGLRRVAEATRLPVAAIGGIAIGNLCEVRATGVAMATVVSAISGDPDPGAAARRLVLMWNEGRGL